VQGITSVIAKMGLRMRHMALSLPKSQLQGAFHTDRHNTVSRSAASGYLDVVLQGADTIATLLFSPSAT